nr:hypothetical protein [Tanacetum cinerariifolium]
MTTLAEFMIIASAENRPPMLDNIMYDSWKSRMELYIKNRLNGRMILNSVKNGPLIWPTVEKNGETRKKKYEELSAAEKLQANSDLKAANIVLQGPPLDVSLFKMAESLYNMFKGGKGNAGISDCHDVQPTIIYNVAFQTDDLNAYDSDCDDISSAKAAAVQATNSFVQQDSMILSVIEQMSEQMINHVTNWKKANQEKHSESLIAELERYKERVKTFKQRLNIDLSSREKLIDS